MAKVQGYRDVVVVDYDSSWPARYERERASIVEALGDVMEGIAGIEHVGSTAVPGLGAKPVIDITVGVRTLVDGEKCVGPMEELGYEYRGDGEIPGRHYFRKFTRGERTHHLNIVEHKGDFWERHILFRDYLREHPQEAQDYYELKVRLAERFGTDRLGYNEAKTAFIELALAKAKGH